MPYKDPEKNRECKRRYKRNHRKQNNQHAKNWRAKNQEHIKLYRKDYNMKHVTEIKQRKQKWWHDNLVKVRENDQKWRNANREKYRELNKIAARKYRLAHPDRRKISNRKWEKKNPEKVLQRYQRHIAKIGRELDLSYHAYQFALRKWSSFIRDIQDNKCQICGKQAVAVHHIIHKVLYPKLSLNINNGIGLCEIHHNEVHGKCLGMIIK